MSNDAIGPAQETRDTDLSEEEIEQLATNYDLLSPSLKQNMWPVVDHMLERCPVAHSDHHGGYTVVSEYAEVFEVLRDWERFGSARKAMLPPAPPDALAPDMPPIHLNPPRQRAYRKLLNPHFTPAALAKFEDGIRQLVTEAIDDFIEVGECEFVSQLARRFPSRVFFRFFCSIEDEESLQKNVAWLKGILFGSPSPEEFARLEREWAEWIYAFIAQRRASEPRGDLIDSLLQEPIDGEPMDDDTVMATMMILIMGGFGTTADATANAVRRMAEQPELQQRLRAEPGLLPKAIEEFLRIDPPVIELPRLCRVDTEIAGHPVKEGERVLVQLGAANHDRHEFDRADEIDIERTGNRHLAFGAGPHRCVGSHLGRLSVRVALEEVLRRMGDIRIPDPAKVEIGVSLQAYGPECMPVTFTKL